MNLRHVSMAVIVAAMAMSGSAFAQAVGVDFGDIKSGVTAAGAGRETMAINAPTVEPGYKVPRLKDGKPDITGVWSDASNTTLRPAGNRTS